MDTLTTVVEVDTYSDQFLKAIGMDPQKYDLGGIKGARLMWSYEIEHMSSGMLHIRPVVPNQAINLDMEIEPRDESQETITKSIKFDLRNVKIEVELSDDVPHSDSFSAIPKRIVIDGTPTVEFEVTK